jgi:hypothetical protein
MGGSVTLVTFLGNFVIPPSLATNFSNKLEEGSGVIGSSYVWSRGLGFETSPIKMRSVQKKATLPHVLPNVVTTSIVLDTKALRGLKSLTREKI